MEIVLHFAAWCGPYLMMLSSICMREVAVYSRLRSASCILLELAPNRLPLPDPENTLTLQHTEAWDKECAVLRGPVSRMPQHY